MYSTYPTYLLHIQYLAQFAKPLADLEDSTNKTPSTGNVTAPISRLTAVDTRDPIIAMYIHRYLQSGETGYRVLKWQLPCGRWPTTLQGPAAGMQWLPITFASTLQWQPSMCNYNYDIHECVGKWLPATLQPHCKGSCRCAKTAMNVQWALTSLATIPAIRGMVTLHVCPLLFSPN